VLKADNATGNFVKVAQRIAVRIRIDPDQPMAKRLQEKFKLSDEGVAYWVVHDSADEDHSDVGRELLDQFAPTDKDKELVIRTVQNTVDVMHVMYDDIYANLKRVPTKSEKAAAA